MALIGQWGNRRFEVSPQVIRSFNDLVLKVVSETDTQNGYGNQYLTRKNWKPLEVSLTVRLTAGLGYDVRSEANAFLNDSMAGGLTGYFYVGGAKLVPAQLMLTDLSIGEIEVNAAGTWAAAEVNLTLKQATLSDAAIAQQQAEAAAAAAAAVAAARSYVPAQTSTASFNIGSTIINTVKTAVTKATTAIKSFVSAAKAVTVARKGNGGR